MIATPLLGLFLNLDARGIGAVALTLLVGTPALTFIGLIGAALRWRCGAAGCCWRCWCCR